MSWHSVALTLHSLTPTVTNPALLYRLPSKSQHREEASKDRQDLKTNSQSKCNCAALIILVPHRIYSISNPICICLPLFTINVTEGLTNAHKTAPELTLTLKEDKEKLTGELKKPWEEQFRGIPSSRDSKQNIFPE